MKKVYLYALVLLLGTVFLVDQQSALSQEPEPAPLANNVEDDERVSETAFAEEREAAQSFIDNINEARRELALKQADIAREKIVMARNLLPIIARVTPAQRRLTRVEFGGGLYANDLGQRESYSPIETTSLENLTRSEGPRWIQNTRKERDALIIYIRLDIEDGKAKTYLDDAEKYITANDFKAAELQLAEISDKVIKIDGTVPEAVQVRDYLLLADNFITAGNFFGGRNALEKAKDFLTIMADEDTYKTYRPDIITLHEDVAGLQSAFAKLDAEQINSAKDNIKKWTQQVSAWAGE